MAKYYNNKDLLGEILYEYPYKEWRRFGSVYRDKDGKNPSKVLSEYGLYDHRDGSYTSLYDLAIELGLRIRRTRGGKIRSQPQELDEIKRLDDGVSALSKYLKSRHIEPNMEHLKTVCPRVKSTPKGYVVYVPLKSPEGEEVSLLEIILDKDYNKVRKLSRVSGEKAPRGIYIPGIEKLFVFEGFEDMMTFSSHISTITDKAKYAGFMAICGCGNMKYVESMLPFYEEIVVILDNDKDNISLRKSMVLGGSPRIKRLIPTSKDDCNSAHARGELREWVRSLKPVPYNIDYDKDNRFMQEVVNKGLWTATHSKVPS